jgi:hypothetical protein
VLLMLFLQRHHDARWREVADVLEERTLDNDTRYGRFSQSQ